MAKYPDRRSAAIPALHLAQEEHGWCSPEAIAQVASVMQLTPAYLTSVATFYDMFKTVPAPRHDVYVCTNISCSLRGADELFEAMLAAAQDAADVDVSSFECLGACDIAPMASVDGEYIGPLTTEDAGQIVEDLRGRAAGARAQAAPLPRAAPTRASPRAPRSSRRRPPTPRGPTPPACPRTASRTGRAERGDRAAGGRDRGRSDAVSEDPVRGHRRAGAGDARRLPAARRLRGAAPRRCRCRARRCSTRS